MRTALLGLFMTLITLICAEAQLTVQVTPVRKDILPGEPAMVNIVIHNSSGHTLKFANQGKTPWLSLHVTQGNTELSNIGRLMPAAIVLKAGESTNTQINAASLYDLTRDGMYRVYVSIISPYDGKTYTSQNPAINVRTGKSLWSTKVGIPPGMPNAGMTCKYSLQSTTENGQSFLYIRTDEVETLRILNTMRLGKYLNFATPIAKVDNKNQLHVLFLHTSDHYAHIVVNTSGKLVKQALFTRSDEMKAGLSRDRNGNILVHGAIPYDPKAKKDVIPGMGDMAF